MRLVRLTTPIIAYLSLITFPPASAQLRQNPSPLTDSTRPHTYIQQQDIPGRRVNLTLGTLLMPPRRATLLFVHFHGASWIAETAAYRTLPQAAVITIQLGVSSDPYAQALAPPGRFRQLVAEAEQACGVRFARIVLSAFSAGYGAVREILKDPESLKHVEAVILADSMHADYTREDTDLGPFIDLARTAATTGRKQFLITHSEVFPGTYVSTTEAADHILKRLNLRRKAVLKWGPSGMQQLSEVHQSGLTILGFAGNSAPDHADHLFALPELVKRLRLTSTQTQPKRKPPAKMQSTHGTR